MAWSIMTIAWMQVIQTGCSNANCPRGLFPTVTAITGKIFTTSPLIEVGTATPMVSLTSVTFQAAQVPTTMETTSLTSVSSLFASSMPMPHMVVTALFGHCLHGLEEAISAADDSGGFATEIWIVAVPMYLHGVVTSMIHAPPRFSYSMV